MIDLHVDFIIQRRLFGYDGARAHRPWVRAQPLFMHADVPRMRQADYHGACLGMHYFPWESERGWRELGRQLDEVDALCERTREATLRVRSPADWQRARAQGRLALAPGVEGAHMLNGDLGRVEQLARRHIAYMTLTHFSKNSAATTGWGRRANATDGLTDFGRALIGELEAHDILLDLAHVNTPGVLEACERSTRPVLCTHTGCRALHDHPRNITDAEIDAIAATGGVIGIIFAPMFLTGRALVDSSCVLDHIEHVIKRVGIEHVALGSDFDGWLATIPRDMRDCRDVSRLFEGLAARGYTPEQVERIATGNALDLLSRQR